MSSEAKMPAMEVNHPMSEAKKEILEKMKEVLTASDDDLKAKNDLIGEFVELCTHLPEGEDYKDWIKNEIAQQAETWCKEDKRLQDVKLIIEYAEEIKASYEDFREHLDQGKSVGSWIVSIEMAKGLFEKMKGDLGASDADFKRLNELIEEFVESYEHRPEGQDYKDWLKDEFVRRSSTWASKSELLQDYTQIVAYAEIFTANSKDFREHLDQGKSADSWIAKKIETGAKATGIDTCQYASTLEEALQKANKDFAGQFEKVHGDISEKFGIALPGGESTVLRGPAGKKIPASGQPAEWNEFIRISVAKDARLQCLNAACGNIAARGAGMLAQRMYNTVMGKEQPDFSDDLEAFCKSSLKEAVNAGLGCAVSGALTVFCRDSQSTLLRAVPGGAMAAVAFDMLDKTRILYQAAEGIMEPVEAIDAVANSACVTYGSIVGGTFGATAGSFIGAVFGPLGAAVGGTAGAYVGNLVGGSVAQKIYEGGKKVVSAIGSGLKSAGSAVASGLKSVGSAFSSGFSSVCSSVGSFISSLW